MEIFPITRERLSQMHEILSASAGYSVSIEEEIEYFDPATAGSVMQNSENQVLGFIRHFNQNSEWGLGELYVQSSIRDRKSVASSLLKKFQETIQLPPGYRLRFDVYTHDLELNEALESAGFSERIQTFRHFECTPKVVDKPRVGECVSITDTKGIAEVFSNLHSTSENEVRQWINGHTIRVVREASKVVAVAQIFDSNDSLRVNRFATHADFLRRGYARKLIEKIFAEAIELGKKRVCLKVEDIRAPAIAFYQSVGFLEDQRKCQTWHSRWY